MKIIRTSCLNGRIENEVDNFVATLENEFDFIVNSVCVRYIDDDGSDTLHHFYVCPPDDFSSGDVSYSS